MSLGAGLSSPSAGAAQKAGSFFDTNNVSRIFGSGGGAAAASGKSGTAGSGSLLHFLAGSGKANSSSLFLAPLKDASPLQVLGTVAAIVVTLLLCEQVLYRYRKGHLPGPTWTTPVIGKFADSLKPSLDNYRKGWDSGPLSVASVFHMCVLGF